MGYDMKVTIMDTGKRTGMTDGLATTEMTTSLKKHPRNGKFDKKMQYSQME
jgi:hypothetical protein